MYGSKPSAFPLRQSSIVWCPQRDSNPQHTVSKTASSASWDTGAYSLFMSGAPPEIRTQTLRGLKPLASAVGLEGHCIWQQLKESNPHRISTMAGISSPVRTLYANCYKFLRIVLGTFTPAGLMHHSECVQTAIPHVCAVFFSGAT